MEGELYNSAYMKKVIDCRKEVSARETSMLEIERPAIGTTDEPLLETW